MLEWNYVDCLRVCRLQTLFNVWDHYVRQAHDSCLSTNDNYTQIWIVLETKFRWFFSSRLLFNTNMITKFWVIEDYPIGYYFWSNKWWLWGKIKKKPMFTSAWVKVCLIFYSTQTLKYSFWNFPSKQHIRIYSCLEYLCVLLHSYSLTLKKRLFWFLFLLNGILARCFSNKYLLNIFFLKAQTKTKTKKKLKQSYLYMSLWIE